VAKRLHASTLIFLLLALPVGLIAGAQQQAGGLLYTQKIYAVSYYVVPPSVTDYVFASADPYMVDFAGVPLYKALLEYDGRILGVQDQVVIQPKLGPQTLAAAQTLLQAPPGTLRVDTTLVYVGYYTSSPKTLACKEALLAVGKDYMTLHAPDGTLLYGVLVLGTDDQGFVHVVSVELLGHPGEACGTPLRTSPAVLALGGISLVIIAASLYAGIVWRKKLDAHVYKEVSI